MFGPAVGLEQQNWLVDTLCKYQTSIGHADNTIFHTCFAYRSKLALLFYWTVRSELFRFGESFALLDRHIRSSFLSFLSCVSLFVLCALFGLVFRLVGTRVTLGQA